MKRLLIPLLTIALASCEKPTIPNSLSQSNVFLHVSPYTQSAMTRGDKLEDDISKLNVMFFQKGTSTRAFDKVKTQTADDDDFGTLSLKLPAGSYDYIIVGHSSARSATIASDKVSFTAQDGRKITDTFWRRDTLTVTDDSDVERDVQLQRATAMFRMVITDTVPPAVTQFKFEYSGGSADFNPASGVGITKSKQTEYRYAEAGHTYDIYTFPRADSDKLTITATALNADGAVVSTRIFEDVPVSARTITQYTGKFFDGETKTIGSSTFTITLNTEWDAVNKYSF